MVKIRKRREKKRREKRREEKRREEKRREEKRRKQNKTEHNRTTQQTEEESKEKKTHYSCQFPLSTLQCSARNQCVRRMREKGREEEHKKVPKKRDCSTLRKPTNNYF